MHCAQALPFFALESSTGSTNGNICASCCAGIATSPCAQFLARAGSPTATGLGLSNILAPLLLPWNGRRSARGKTGSSDGNGCAREWPSGRVALADSVPCSCMCACQCSSASLCTWACASACVYSRPPGSSHRCRRHLRRFRNLPRSTAGAAAVSVFVYVFVYVYVYMECTYASVYVYARPPIV